MPYLPQTISEGAFSAWKDLAHTGGGVAAPATNGTYIMYQTGSIALGGAASAFGAFHLDPADYNVPSRTSKIRLKAVIVGNAVAPAATITCHLYPVATWNGASGSRAGIATVGSSVCSAQWVTPAANTRDTKLSTEVNFPAAGFYCLAYVLSAAVAANSNVEILTQLQYRQT